MREVSKKDARLILDIMGNLWSEHDRPCEECPAAKAEVRKYHTLLDTLAPLPYKDDGTLDIAKVTFDEAGTHSTEDDAHPKRMIKSRSLEGLQHSAAARGLQITNLASYSVVYWEMPEGRTLSYHCDLE
jgi:hypothetical protein